MKRIWLISGASAAAVLIVLVMVLTGLRPGTTSGPAQAEPAAADTASHTVVTQDWLQQNSLLGVAGLDARNRDFTQLTPADLARLTYDSKTQWPEQRWLPAGFTPATALAAANPGLGLRQLHQQGITGQGIHVAMIDKYILPDHKELAGRIEFVQVYPKTSPVAPHFHGMATASILTGNTVGVAPGAFLHYYAVPDDQNGFKNYVVALDQIVKRNATLPKEQRIRVVSVSWGPDNATRAQWDDLVAKAAQQGMEVVYSTERPAARYLCAKLLPGGDPNDPNTYDWDDWVLQNSTRSGLASFLGVPAGNIVTASVAAPDAYVHWGGSGLSWGIPYMAGLLTLGLQANPDASFDHLYQAIVETSVTNAQGIRMVNPAAYIAAVRK